ncbi:MAG: TIGR01777 family protein [Bryobacterales bacterium]|nr:TIGR01777 family protein [Bryobacterales bacterium]
MRVTVTGASGFIGSRLVAHLNAHGHEVRLVGRAPRKGMLASARFSIWDAAASEPPADALEAADAVIHLAGEPVAQRWTPDVKRRIRASRVDSTNLLVNALGKVGARPRVLVCASATGYYGDRGEETLTESSTPGTGFLPEVCVEWERAASRAREMGVRVVPVRTGMVLHPEGGALDQMLPPFRWGAGGRIGSGQQWMSWIHMADMVRLLAHAAVTPGLDAPLNATSPNPVRNAEFTRTLGRTLRRPAILPVPEFMVRMLFGEMASVVTASQRVTPRAVLDSGFRFEHELLGPALVNLLVEKQAE